MRQPTRRTMRSVAFAVHPAWLLVPAVLVSIFAIARLAVRVL